ncbi:bifunctional 4-hydroxy-2-oxoglutarate aldolase/2-dehydro-3-deoxy-phosphogluconate aldolase [Parablautia sp. Marseille-Q6255]|uniref:bifunctional 4-hydroxy-2-oxoglutarate aldolase/2-dehydro-3-deoxy-phosphogluconate aldolase n=1 Tax=Parablautia sp. Marseille-Q6255 TaxID=3039593 RepID=UPI0024BC7550|nr:bifunctional 4-hydroxy-2-oxoglutarate aldolase/2-dehydro-3-deoxy-phosphogluconate aldolase [Parablautia sp. Marseille-Q6255]
MTIFEKMKETGIVPVIKIPSAEHAVPLARTLLEAGIPQIEVTLRNECALDCIRAIKKELPQMTVAAGTVLSPEQVQLAKEAGAELCVTPGFNEDVVKACQEADIPVLPGAVTATEIERGMKLGLHIFKFFPAELLGGVKTIKELTGPYSNIEFVPTSGIRMDNMGNYLSNPKVAAVGGSFMAPADKVLAKDWEGIRALCEKAVAVSHNFHLVHIGLNLENEAAAKDMAEELGAMFGIGYRAGGRSDFAGELFECCKIKFPGEKGHIAIGVRSVERAMAYLQKKGYAMREEFKNYTSAGKLNAVYLEKEFGGFAIHLLNRP